MGFFGMTVANQVGFSALSSFSVDSQTDIGKRTLSWVINFSNNGALEACSAASKNIIRGRTSHRKHVDQIILYTVHRFWKIRISGIHAFACTILLGKLMWDFDVLEVVLVSWKWNVEWVCLDSWNLRHISHFIMTLNCLLQPFLMAVDSWSRVASLYFVDIESVIGH